MPYKLKAALLVLISITGIILVFLRPAIPQDPVFHGFADKRTILSVPNFWNVSSNLLFLVSGVLGLRLLIRNKAGLIHQRLKQNNLVFFAGILLTAAGSCYYHLHPSNSTLVWDRLPMTISFMAFLSITIGIFISERAGKIVVVPLLLIGIFSVWYWNYTEAQGAGDLRLYFVVQFLPMLLIPLMVLLFKRPGAPVKQIWLVLLAYLVAKILEATDHRVYEMLGFISGHSLKHIVAAFAPLIYLVAIRKTQQPESAERAE
ncbi:MAG: hypothetical protein K0S33_1313 [Bacteroidetes bacterium]|nr:hypothetical protein [Bacteroidota bacterium]